MATLMRGKALGIFAAAGALALAGAPANAATLPSAAPAPYTCTGGEIGSGTYTSLRVKGDCSIAADAVVKVLGHVTVDAGASLDAQSVPSTLNVGGNVTGGAGSFVGLGCQPPSLTGNSAHSCVEGYEEDASDITVQGNVSVSRAMAVMLNGITVKGSVTLSGGGSPIPWSIKNNTILGSLTVKGQRTEWVGVLFNNVKGNVTLTDIVLSDPHPGAPGVYIVRNTVGGNLSCTKLEPGVSGGFVPGSVNVVGGTATGQCADLV